MSANPTLDELFQHCERSALHLEMRDGYGNSSPGFRAWREGVPSIGPTSTRHGST